MKTKKPLTILFDANPMAISGKSGVGYFTNRLIAALASEYPQELRLVGHYYNFLGRKKSLDLVYAKNVSYRETRILPGKVFNGLRRKLHIEFPLEILARQKADVLLFPNFAISPSLFHQPRIVTIHDLYFTEHPEHINVNNLDFMQRFVPPAIHNADVVITLSQFTTRAVVEKYGIPESKMLTLSIPPLAPVMVSKKQLIMTLDDLGVKKEYLLFLGNIEPRKNLVALVRAYELLPKDLRDKYSLVLAGGKGWNDEEILASVASAQKAGNEVIMTGYVSDDQKAALYQGATLLVLPSHYEGFGMQILEAMSYSVPITISDIPVFHEVAGDAATYFNQNYQHSIASSIKKLLDSPKHRSNLVQKSKKQLAHYSWSHVAKQVYTMLRITTLS